MTHCLTVTDPLSGRVTDPLFGRVIASLSGRVTDSLSGCLSDWPCVCLLFQEDEADEEDENPDEDVGFVSDKQTWHTLIKLTIIHSKMRNNILYIV